MAELALVLPVLLVLLLGIAQFGVAFNNSRNTIAPFIAGLVADGITTVSGAQHIDRGYAGFAESLQGLGADVTREPDDDPFL